MGMGEMVLLIVGGVCIVGSLTLAFIILWNSPEGADRDRPETRIPTTDE